MKDEREKILRAIEDIAEQVVEKISDDQIIGLGSGSAVAVFVKKLGKRATDEGVTFNVISSSLQIQLAAEQSGLNSFPHKMIPEIDITVDGADQIDEEFNMIKGGGGALYRERILLSAAKKSIILADENKYVKQLSRSVPIETSYFARSFVSDELKKIGGKAKLRLLEKDYPFTTQNGNIIFDTDFGVIDRPLITLNKINNIAGIIDLGVFIDEGNVFYKANRDSSVQVFEV